MFDVLTSQHGNSVVHLWWQTGAVVSCGSQVCDPRFVPSVYDDVAFAWPELPPLSYLVTVDGLVVTVTDRVITSIEPVAGGRVECLPVPVLDSWGRSGPAGTLDVPVIQVDVPDGILPVTSGQPGPLDHEALVRSGLFDVPAASLWLGR